MKPAVRRALAVALAIVCVAWAATSGVVLVPGVDQGPIEETNAESSSNPDNVSISRMTNASTGAEYGFLAEYGDYIYKDETSTSSPYGEIQIFKQSGDEISKAHEYNLSYASSGWDIDKSTGHLYLPDRTNSLLKQYTIQSDGNISFKREFDITSQGDTSPYPIDVAVTEGWVFSKDTNELDTFKLSDDRSSISFHQTYGTGSQDFVIADNGYAYLSASYNHQFAIDETRALQKTGEYDMYGDTCTGACMSGDYGTISEDGFAYELGLDENNNAELYVWNLSQGSSKYPQYEDRVTRTDSPWMYNPDIEGDVLYVPNYDGNEVMIFNITDRASPSLIKSETNNRPSALSVDGARLTVNERDPYSMTLYDTNYSAPAGGNTVSGQLTDSEGALVAGATVELWGVKRPNVDKGDLQTVKDREREIVQEMQDIEPDTWDPTRRLTGTNSLYSNADTEVVLAHTTEQWPTTELIVDGDEIDNPQLRLPADERFVLSVWDPSDEDLLEDNLEAPLPGGVIDDTDIVVEPLTSDEDGLEEQTYETDERVNMGGALGADHDYAEVSLPRGFYRVYPEGSPEAGYTIVVGQPGQIVSGIEDKLQTKADQLTERAQLIQDKLNNDKVIRKRTTTNATGHWSISVPTGVKTATVQAYAQPQGINVDAKNLTIGDIRTYYETTDYNGSFLLPSQPTDVSPPESGVDVTVREVETPSYPGLDRFKNWSEWFQNQVANESFGNVSALSAQQLQAINASRDDLEALYNETNRLREQNERLDERYRELLNETRGIETDPEVNVTLDPDTVTEAQLRENISLLKQSIASLQETIDSQEPEVIQRGNDSIDEGDIIDGVLDGLPGSSDADTNSTAGTNTVSVDFPFSTELAPEHVSVFARYPNGTEAVVADRYWGVEKRAAQGDVVAVKNYPLGGAASVEFRVDVAKTGGTGSATKRVANPTFNGTTPALESLAFSELRPGPDDTVRATLTPADAANFRNVTGVDVTVPNGTTISGTVESARTVSFDTVAQGPHHVEITYANPAGDTFSVATAIEAGGEDLKMPPGIRIASGPAAGTYAMVGEGLSGGSVDIQSGGLEIGIVATIAQADDVPAQLHVYTKGTSIHPDADISVRVARGEDRAGISERLQVVIHHKSVPEGALLRRNGDPVARGDNAFGRAVDQGDQFLIETVTGEDATVDISINSNPGLLDRVSWRIDRTLDTLPTPDLPVIGAVAPLPFVGLFVARRRWSR